MEWRLFADVAEVAGDGRVSVDVPPDATVGDALDALLDQEPALRERVLDDDGDLEAHLTVLRNGENVAPEGGLDAEVAPDDELALLPPVSGG